ncbi:MAG: hypothetical protein K2X50_03670 [Gammaproteobacteria bacterium]|nr:hypothetical protein [Gammaproteobacteria bacterium]
MSQIKKELDSFTIKELRATVKAVSANQKNDGCLPIKGGVLILDFQALFASDYYGKWYLIGGETTRKILKNLHQNNVQICLIYYGDKKIANAGLELLKQERISHYFQFLLYSYHYDNKKSLLQACRSTFVPEKKNHQEYIGRLVFLGHQRRDMMANKELYLTGILATCNSLNGNVKNKEELFFGLGSVQQHFGLRKIKTNSQINTAVDDFTVAEVEENKNTTWLSRAWQNFINKLGDYKVDPRVPILEEAKPVPATFSQWILRNFFFPSWWKTWNYDGFKSALTTAFLVIVGFDGYDCTTGQVVYADDTRKDNEDKRYLGRYINKSLLKAAFFGLPSRPTAYPAASGAVVPDLTRLQLLSNFVGGIDWNEKTPEEKKMLQGIFFIRFPLVVVFNLITWPIKILLNCVRMVSELLPWITTIVIFSGLLRTLFAAHEFYQFGVHLYKVEAPKEEILDNLLGWPKYWLSKIGMVLAMFPMLLAGVLSLAVFSIYTVFNIAFFIGRAATSPAQTMLMAFANGKSLTISRFGPVVETMISYFVGGLCAILSISVSISIWALVFPLVYGAVVSFTPLVVLQKVNLVLQFPVVTSSLSWVQGIFFTVKPIFMSIFGFALTSVSTFVGIDITSLAILGILLVAVVVPLAIVTNKLCNVWADWHETNAIVDTTAKSAHDEIILTDADFEERDYSYSIDDDKKDSSFYSRFIESKLTAVARFFSGHSAATEEKVKIKRQIEGSAYYAANGVDRAALRAQQGENHMKGNRPLSPLKIEFDFDQLEQKL